MRHIAIAIACAAFGCVQTIDCPGQNESNDTGITTAPSDTSTAIKVCKMPQEFQMFQFCFDPTCCDSSKDELDTFCANSMGPMTEATVCSKHPISGTDTDGRHCNETGLVVKCPEGGDPFVVECCEPAAK